MTAKIWAVASGKGGVGKSFITSSLSILLAEKFRVVVVDLDLGGANLHTFLGIRHPERSLSDFLDKEVSHIEEVCVETSIPNLRLISGAKDSLNIANLHYAHKQKLVRHLQSLDADYILMDLGAGTTYNTLDFFILANLQLLVVIPEPTSIENAYRFIKSAFYRKIRQESPNSWVRSIVDQAMTANNPHGIRTPLELGNHLKQLNEGYDAFVDAQFQSFFPKLILNQIQNDPEIKMSQAMDQACAKYFGIHLDFVGHVSHNHTVHTTLNRRQSLPEWLEESFIRYQIEDIAQTLIKR